MSTVLSVSGYPWCGHAMYCTMRQVANRILKEKQMAFTGNPDDPYELEHQLTEASIKLADSKAKLAQAKKELALSNHLKHVNKLVNAKLELNRLKSHSLFYRVANFFGLK